MSMRDQQLTVAMPKPLRAALKARAAEQQRSEGDIVRLILTAVLLDPDETQEATR